MLRAAPLDLGGEVHEQRTTFDQMMAATPVPADVQTSRRRRLRSPLSLTPALPPTS
jgi:hypothetical protein